MVSELLVRVKKLDFSLKMNLFSWAVYAVVASVVSWGYIGVQLKENMNCFQDEFINFGLYFLYYIPNKNIIQDSTYVYPRLMNRNRVCLYYFKIYFKSTLIYFTGINIINLAISIILGEPIRFVALVFYLIYSLATFMVFNLLGSILMTKWNINYVTPIAVVHLCLSYVLSLFVTDFYLVSISFYGMAAPGTYSYVPLQYTLLTYSVYLLIMSLIWIIPNEGSDKLRRCGANLKRYLPLLLISIPVIGLFFYTYSISQEYGRSFTYYFDLMSYHYIKLMMRYDISNRDPQLILSFVTVLGLCTFYLISQKFEERKLLYMLAHRYGGREKLCEYTVVSTLKESLVSLGWILGLFAFWSMLFGGFRFGMSFHTFIAYVLYAVRLYAVICNMGLLISLLMLKNNSGVAFASTFVAAVLLMMVDLNTMNIAIMCTDDNLLHSILGLVTLAAVLVLQLFVLGKQIYKVEI